MAVFIQCAALRFCAGSDGWILRLISWWSKCGASHRKKCGHVTPKWELRSARTALDVYAG
jgi:hypothetical protein